MLSHRMLRTRRMRSERGATLVEFAIVSILLFTLVLGIIDFGMMLKNYQTLSNVAREGARAAAVGKTVGDVNDSITSWASRLGIKDGTLTGVVITCGAPGTDPSTWTELGDNGSENDAPSGNDIKVELTCLYNLSTGNFLASVAGISNPVTLRASMVMRRE